MPGHTLYAHVDGCDLDEVADRMEAALLALVDGHTWSRRTWVVNRRHPPDPADGPDDLPGWELGLNHELPDPHTEEEGWFDDVERIATALADLASKTGREFVVGIGDTETGIAEDLHVIEAGKPDLDRLGEIIGVEPPPPDGGQSAT